MGVKLGLSHRKVTEEDIGPKRDKHVIKGERRKVQNKELHKLFIIKLSSQGGRDGRDMWHARGYKKCIKNYPGNQKGIWET
jgi:hypothetical protein